MQGGNSFEGAYTDLTYLNTPMVNVTLVGSPEGVLFSPSLPDTKELIVNCLKEIVENTDQFPRIEVWCSMLLPLMNLSEVGFLSKVLIYNFCIFEIWKCCILLHL